MRKALAIRAWIVAVMALAAGLAWSTAAQDGGQGPLLGYVTGPDRVVVLNLAAFERVETILGPAEVQFLSSSPKFGPESRLYIADGETGRLQVVDLEEREFVDHIEVGGRPNDLEILGDKALVNDFSGDRVVIVDLAKREVAGSWALNGQGPAANEIALAPDGSRAYLTTFDFEESVPHESTHPLVVLEIASRDGELELRPVRTIPLEGRLNGEDLVVPYLASSVAVSSDGKRVYVLAVDDFEEEPTVFVVDAEELHVTETIPVELGRRARSPFVNILALSPDGRTIAVSAFRNGLALLDLETREVRVAKPTGPRLTDPEVNGVTFGPESRVVYAVGYVGQGEVGFVAAFDVETGQQLNVLSLRRQPLLFMAVPGGTTF